ncbi:MAG: ComEC/Rec2 family competence protein [Treponema sp.]
MMNTQILVPPIIPAALSALISFYSLYGLRRYLPAGYMYAVLIIGASCIAAIGWGMRYTYRIRHTEKAGHTSTPILFHITGRCLLFAVTVGMIAGIYSENTVHIHQMPPKTLVPLRSVTGAVLLLTGEPVPAGSGSYSISARLLACTDDEGAVYSAQSDLSLRIPAPIVQETLSGGIGCTATSLTARDIPPLNLIEYTRGDLRRRKELGISKNLVRFLEMPDEFFNKSFNYYDLSKNIANKSKENLLKNEVFRGSLQHYASDTDIDPCRFYVRGIYLFVQGRFGKTGAAFFADNCKPVFLGWQSALARIRAFLRFALMRILYTWGDAGGLLLALLAADRSFLSKACMEAFKHAGLSHILALSGMHVSLISTAALQSSVFVGGRKHAIGLSLAAVCLFVWFAGSAPSLNRALGMLLIAAAGNVLHIRPTPLAVLSAMLFMHIICYAPDALTLGFMLSYSACAGIIVFGAAFSRGIITQAASIPRGITESISASLGAQSFTAPIVAHYIGTIASAGIIASCVISPLISLFLIAGLVCIPIAICVPHAAPILAPVFNILYGVIYRCAAFFSSFPLITAHNHSSAFILGSTLFLCGFLTVLWAFLDEHKERQKLTLLFMES